MNPNFQVPARFEEQKRQETLVRRRFWAKARRTLGRIPFSSDLFAAYYCATDPATPRQAKAVLVAALAYFIIPTDMIPDFIASLGYTDDAAVLMAALRTVRGHMKPAHEERAKRALSAPEA
tara:strand:- start:50 stop:412 length:363 start_codon:yes stop_codon:yes gene_type:complete